MVVLLCNYSYGPSRGSSCSTQLYRGSRKLHHQAHRTISRSTSRKHETSCLLLLLHTRRRPLRVGTYSVGRCGRQQHNAVRSSSCSVELLGIEWPATTGHAVLFPFQILELALRRIQTAAEPTHHFFETLQNTHFPTPSTIFLRPCQTLLLPLPVVLLSLLIREMFPLTGFPRG